MAFVDRVVEHPGRVRLTPVEGVENVYDMTREEGTVTEEGTPLNATNLNAEMRNLADEQMADISNAVAVDTAGNVHTRNLQAGYVSHSHASGSTTVTTQVTFSRAFTSIPHVVATPQTVAPHQNFASVSEITTTGFKITTYRTTAGSIVARWIAHR